MTPWMMPPAATVLHVRGTLLVTAATPLQLLQRKTQRATFTIPQVVLEDLLAIADQDGRSLSNVIAYMVESRLEEYKNCLLYTSDAADE